MITVLVLETVALYLTRYMPSSWQVRGKDCSPFGITLCILCLSIAMVQIFTGRSLLERAHLTKNVLT
jgi:hypothetical protein